MYKILVTTIVKVDTYKQPSSVVIDTLVIDFETKEEAIEAANQLGSIDIYNAQRSAKCLFSRF